MAKSSNQKHPELRRGEVFITNIFLQDGTIPLLIGPRGDHLSDWEAIDWKTKRMGNIAYDIRGNPIPGMRPVFA